MSTPNMGLTLPTVSQTPGPQWASEINSDLSLLDSHDHTTGKGMQVPVAGLNIDDDLPLGGLYGVEQASFLGLWPQLSAPAGATRFYSDASGNLFYKNGSGVPVQITTGTSVVPGVSGGITGLVSPASVSYDVGSETFKFYRDTGASAFGTVEHGPLVLHTATAGAAGLQIQPSASMVTGYTLTLPPTLPASVASFHSVSTSGVMENVAPDNSTIEISSNTLQIKPLGIDTAQISDGAITQIKIGNGEVSQIKLGAAMYSVSSTSTGATQFSSLPSSPDQIVTELSVTLVLTSLRPIIAFCMSDLTSQNSYFHATVHDAQAMIRVTAPSGPVVNMSRVLLKKDIYSPASVMNGFYVPAVTGAHTITVFVSAPGVSGDLDIYYMKLVAHQL